MTRTQEIIKLVSKPINREVFMAGQEPGLGDRSVFTHDLYRDGQKIGFDGGQCTVVRSDETGAYILCSVSMTLPEGTMTFQTFMKELFPPPPFFTAITGGTGAYIGARGEMHIDPASPDTHHYTIFIDQPDR